MNTYEQLKIAVVAEVIEKRQAVAVSYIRHQPRDVKSNASSIWSPFFQTDSKAHWSDHGCKTFLGNKKESLPKAIQWAVDTYGELNFVRNREGDYVPKAVNDKFPIPKD